jgi:hypothetical protein
MAKAKTSKKKPAKRKAAATRPAKKRAAKKTAAKGKKVFVTEGPLPAKQALKVVKQLQKMSLPPSHPTDAVTGPALALNYQAPMPTPAKPARKKSRTAKKKKR